MSLQKGKYPLGTHTIQHQQRGPHTIPTRGQTPSVGREEYRIAYSQPPLRQLTQAVPGLTGGAPHDMSKQGPLPTQATPTALYSPQGGGPGSQLNQSVMAGQPPGGTSSAGPSPQPPGVISQAQGQQLQPRGPECELGYNPYFFGAPRQSGPRQVPNMTRAGINHIGVPTPTPSPAAQFPPNQMTTMLYPPAAGGFPHMSPQAMIVSPQLFSHQQRSAYSTPPQYPVSTSQQPTMFISAQNPAPYNFSSAQGTGAVYFTPVTIPMHTSRPGVPTVNQTNMPSAQRKEKKIITIVNPTTGQDVTQDIMSGGSSVPPSMSGSSSTRGVSPDMGSGTTDIAAQFAAQVAAAASTVRKDHPQGSKTSVSAFQGEYLSHSHLNATASADKRDSGDFRSLPVSTLEHTIHTDHSKTLGRVSPTCSSPVTNVADEQDSLNQRTVPVSNQVSTSVNDTIPEITQKSLRLTISEPEPLEPCGVVEQQSLGMILETVTVPEETPAVNKTHILNSVSIVQSQDVVSTEQQVITEVLLNEPAYPATMSAEEERIEVSDEPMPNKGLPAQKEVRQKPEEKTKVLDEEKRTEGELPKVKPQQNGEVVEMPVVTPAGGAKDVAEAKESKKSARAQWKKRMQEINKKGDSKEGGDMDAFVMDKDEISSGPGSVTNTPIPSKSPSPISMTLATTDGEIGSDETEEERKVAEKNEENVRVSQEMQDNEQALLLKEIPVIETPRPQLSIPLKYNYKEDQWSPLNPEGKKQYDRAFLLTLQSQPMSMCKPKGLPNLEVIKEQAIQHKLPDINRTSAPSQPPRNYSDPFMPMYARGGNARPPTGSVGRRQSQQSRDKVKKVITITSSLNQEIKLHECDNAWKPTHKGPGDMDEEDLHTQELFKRVRGILNKLTPQMFHTLVGQVKDLPIDNESKLKGVIDLVFEKAIDEPNFSVPYANMCKQLALIKVPLAGPGQEVNFRKLLLTKCQREFEKDIGDELKKEERLKEIENEPSEEKKKQLQDDLDDLEKRARRRSLGNIKFIGELFKLNMLTPPIMHDCLKKLLNQGDEDSLECLCRLLTTIGKELDNDKSKPTSKAQMDNYFLTMQRIVKQRQTTSRVRFMIQDVLELRAKNWIPRRDDNNPKTIDQIHQEAQREQVERQLLVQQQPPPPIPKRNDDRDRRKGRGSGPHPSDDGWNTVGNKSRTSTSNSFDATRLKQLAKTSSEIETIQLGPGGRGSQLQWARGSSGGTKVSQEVDKVSRPENRYSALADQTNLDSRRSTQRSAASSRESSRGRGSLPPPTPIRKTPSQTSSREREQVLAAVKNITASVVQEQKVVENRDITETKENRPEGGLRGEDMSLEELEKRTRSLIDEFLHNSDFEDAVLCVAELVSPSTVQGFITCAINHVLERSSQARRHVGQLLHNLVKRHVISLKQYVSGLQAILELAEDFAIDIPHIWEYLGELIGPVVEDSSIPLDFLKEAAEVCLPFKTAGKLISSVLHSAAKHMGSSKVGDCWKKSGLHWSCFVPSDVVLSDFLKQNKLEFTLDTVQIVPAKDELTLEQIKEEFDFLLRKKQASNEDIFDWIEANVGESRTKDTQFIRVLVAAVVESAIKDEGATCKFESKTMKPRIPLLQRFLDQKEHLDLQALYAIQALINRLQHPQGVLRQIFDTVYDEDLISDDAFIQWECSKDPAEQEGKGVALKSVTTFFTWLREAEDESVEEN